ncbi:MAG: hypothetical protein ACI4I1_04900 [Oscillospiraceae bacterium]
MQKCPICGGTVGNGVCLSCGYEIPDENTIAAPYNYDPDDYALQEDSHDENEPSEWAEMDAIGVPSSESVSQAFVKKPSLEKPAADNRTAEKSTPPPTNYTHITAPSEEPYEEPQDAFSIFVQGFVYEVKRHWWKVLLILLVPAAATFMGCFYMAKARGWRVSRFERMDPANFDVKAFFLGILYMVIGFGLIFSGWDPLGLSAWIMSVL